MNEVEISLQWQIYFPLRLKYYALPRAHSLLALLQKWFQDYKDVISMAI